MAQHVTNRWTVGEYTFAEYEGYGDGPTYGFLINGESRSSEIYESLDRAIVEAVGQKHTGPVRAHGSGTGSAAAWFMKMIGAENPA